MIRSTHDNQGKENIHASGLVKRRPSKLADCLRPKTMGGLGLLNKKKMNIALLLKWIWRLYQDEDTIWTQILRAKYQNASSILTGSGQGGTPGRDYIKSSSSLLWGQDSW
jgi:hypothetical protein